MQIKECEEVSQDVAVRFLDDLAASVVEGKMKHEDIKQAKKSWMAEKLKTGTPTAASSGLKRSLAGEAGQASKRNRGKQRDATAEVAEKDSKAAKTVAPKGEGKAAKTAPEGEAQAAETVAATVKGKAPKGKAKADCCSTDEDPLSDMELPPGGDIFG